MACTGECGSCSTKLDKAIAELEPQRSGYRDEQVGPIIAPAKKELAEPEL